MSDNLTAEHRNTKGKFKECTWEGHKSLLLTCKVDQNHWSSGSMHQAQWYTLRWLSMLSRHDMVYAVNKCRKHEIQAGQAEKYSCSAGGGYSLKYVWVKRLLLKGDTEHRPTYSVLKLSHWVPSANGLIFILLILNPFPCPTTVTCKVKQATG